MIPQVVVAFIIWPGLSKEKFEIPLMVVSRPRNSLLGKGHVSSLDGDERITWWENGETFWITRWQDVSSMKTKSQKTINKYYLKSEQSKTKRTYIFPRRYVCDQSPTHTTAI
jgi:hypothetical protein